MSPQDLEAAQVAVRAAEAQIKSSEAAVSQSKASLNQSEVNLQHTVIEAPIDGIVISRNVDVGQTVAASMNAPVLFIIAADLTKMQVNANVDESDVGRIRAGQVVRFRVDAYPIEEFIGAVSQVRLQPIVTQNVVTYATVIDVPNPQFKLKPGMTATVTIEIARRNDVRARAERGAALPAERRHLRGAEPGGAAGDAARRGRRPHGWTGRGAARAAAASPAQAAPAGAAAPPAEGRGDAQPGGPAGQPSQSARAGAGRRPASAGRRARRRRSARRRGSAASAAEAAGRLRRRPERQTPRNARSASRSGWPA